ncbi:MAG: SPOR domain-containing protein [Rhodobacteraceae bacterium]|nr:SPOR domain-containing protein [Paracoccaceae bacterium]
MSESRLNIDNTGSGADDQQAGGLAAQIAKWSGGIVSLVLILGVVYWVFELGKRDANDVPVIQAMGGVARERPEDPQGTQANNQGLDVNAVLASDETAPVGAETQLAPPPQRATVEDVPVSDQPATPVPDTVVPLLQAEPVVVETQAPVETLLTEPETPIESAEPVIESDMTRPVRRVEQPGLSSSAEQLSDAIAAAIAQEASDNAPDTAPVEPVISEPGGAVTQVPVGTQMIQLGVFDDEQSAIRNWDFLLSNQPDLLSGLTRYIERREAGGRVFYRLRAIGFADPAAASDLCGVLMGRDVQCIPVTAR